mgnify:CR=1 FL=1
MIRYIRYAFLAALAVVLIAVAMANRGFVTLNILPAALADLTRFSWSISLPLYVVIFASIAADCISPNMSRLLLLELLSVPSATFTPAFNKRCTGQIPLASFMFDSGQ